MRCRGWRRSKGVQRSKVPTRSGEMRQSIAGRRGADAWQELQHAERGDGVSRVLDPSQYAQHIFDMSRLKELQPAVLYEWGTAAPEFNLELVAMVARTEQHSLSFQVNACLAVLQDTLNDVLDLCCFIGRYDRLRSFPGGLV
jgi:hypothetical protein